MDSIYRETFTSKFIIKESNIYIKINWENNKDDLFQIQVFEEEQSWSGRFSKESAETFRCDEENEDLYSKNVKNALKQQDNMYTFDFEKNKDTAKFTWKRTFINSTAVLLHGSVSLQRDAQIVNKNDIIDALLDENKKLKDTIECCKNKIDLLSSELEKNNTELEKFIDIKTSLETNLYGKFIKLLNTKKRRIQLLEDQIKDIE